MSIEFQVEGMSCQHCVSSVTQAIRQQDANASVDVSLVAGTIKVESPIAADVLKAAIDDAGYKVVGARVDHPG
ncbi:heavy-metal-associated domain-containing protein [Paraburkholderia phosphatilytica]|uniref:heavy-metal-associated domain-containing protein n=1 Tax=Paraburkholderia phosphatilytica TaxID=2282883 RepID=UPI000E5415FE|nr:heavy-metal-associated domain-containing protein [Paraburkholderia phosphatilytica]